MPRIKAELLTERETEILNTLWKLGTASADEVRAALPDDPHDSTIRTLLRILESKGYVEHDVRGKSYIYRPAVERAQVQRSALRSLLGRMFAGSAEDLVVRLIEDDILTPAQLEQIRASVKPPRPGRRKGGSK